MPELFIELFSEEIPARMQARAADDLCRLLTEALAPLSPTEVRGFYGARRIAAVATVAAGVAESRSVERGPRRSAPEQALAGFLRKFNAPREDLREEGEFWVLERVVPGVEAAGLVASVMPGLLRRFPWPKSMRWGGTSGFTWVRPLRRITCVLDGAVVPFDLRDGADDGHGLVSGNQTEGHRFHAPGAFTVTSCAQWAEELMARQVVVQAAERKRMIAEGLAGLAATRGLAVLEDQGLLDEVAGLVEWPVPLIGAIDPAYMDLPPEVMQVSMRVNQRYFALRDALGRAAPFFAFVANIEAGDGGNAIIAGNERVLRARFADARHFWDLDRHATLASRVAALEGITFHAKLGTQGARVKRLVALAGKLAPLVGADVALAERAALLAKADLTTGMVGEFPELQGVMGGYYATHDGENPAVAAAVRDHYLPKGPGDGLPENPVGVAVALADKLDQISGFFGVGERPTGSGDPYALRRAALGSISLIRSSNARVSLREHLRSALREHMRTCAARFGGTITTAVRDLWNERAYVLRPLLDLETTFAAHFFRAKGTFSLINVALDLPNDPVPQDKIKYIEGACYDFGILFPDAYHRDNPALKRLSRLPYTEGLVEAQVLIETQSDSLNEEDRSDIDEFMALSRWLDASVLDPLAIEALSFIVERLRVQMRADGARHDVLNAVLGAGADDDIVRLLARTAAVSDFLGTESGGNLLAAYRRAANLLRIEEKKGAETFDGAINSDLLEEAAERDLALAIGQVGPEVAAAIGHERFTDAMASLAALRGPVDQFFEMILVNAERAELRQNRLRLLFHLRAAMNMAADFSRIEG